MTKKQNKTKTSSFGVSGRYGHDSSKFYNSRLYSNLKTENKKTIKENKIKSKYLNKIYCKSSEDMSEISDNSIHLMVTSPPYNVTKEYDEDLTLKEYLELLKQVFSETFRVLVPGGRICINVANLGRKPYIPLTSFINQIMINIGFLMRGEIIWNKAASSGGSCAWGSWKSPSNPSLRDVHEYILIFSKFKYARKIKKKITISKNEFLEFTKSIWTFNTESAKKVGHPAPFPVELPYRLIQLYTYKGDVVLDPFCGSGTTCIAAKKTERYYIGYDINKEYIKLAKKRIKNFFHQDSLFKK
jgi:site-specific DNA-methyltransferase (adenine-specific)